MAVGREQDDDFQNSEFNFEDDPEELDQKRRVRKMIEERLEQKRLKKELKDEFDDEFDWDD